MGVVLAILAGALLIFVYCACAWRNTKDQDLWDAQRRVYDEYLQDEDEGY